MYVVIVAIVVVGLIVGIRWLRTRKALERNKNVNLAVKSRLANKNFNITKMFKVIDCYSIDATEDEKFKQILFDMDNKKACLIDYRSGKEYIVDFADIIECEIYKNNVVSGSGSRYNDYHRHHSHIEEQCVDMRLIIKINNLDKPQIVYDVVYGNNAINKRLEDYQILINYLMEIESFLDVIKNDKSAIAKKEFVFCQYCGAKNHADSLKCESCGGDLK